MLTHEQKLKIIRQHRIKTEQALNSMMSEHTEHPYGRKFCTDAFAARPHAWADDSLDELIFYRSTSHYLAEWLTYDEGMTRKLDDLRKKEARGQCHGATEAFVSQMHDGHDGPFFINTRDVDNCLLDTTMAFDAFEHAGGEYVVLRIYGGQDTNDGFTRPRVFACDSLDTFTIRYSELWMKCKCGSVGLTYGRFEINEGLDDVDADSLPKRWKYADRQLHCTKCDTTVDLL